MKGNITIDQIKEIQSLKNQGLTIREWKIKMRELAQKLDLTDREILDINRGDF